MSWTEIKKAVNSKPNTMPLDKMFGWEFVQIIHMTASGDAFQTSQATVSGVDGVAVCYMHTGKYSSSKATILMKTNDDTSSMVVSSVENTEKCTLLLPLSKDVKYVFSANVAAQFYVAIFSFGGGIS